MDAIQRIHLQKPPVSSAQKHSLAQITPVRCNQRKTFKDDGDDAANRYADANTDEGNMENLKSETTTSRSRRARRRSSMPIMNGCSQTQAKSISPRASNSRGTRTKKRRSITSEKTHRTRNRPHKHGEDESGISPGSWEALNDSSFQRSPRDGSISSLLNAQSNTGMEWERLPSMSFSRQDSVGTTVEVRPLNCGDEENGVLFGAVVAGGKCNIDDKSLNLVELFDFNQRKWSRLPSMRTSRCGCAIASVGNTVLVMGGIADGQHFASAERYLLDASYFGGQQQHQPQAKDQWTLVASMTAPRSYCAAVGLPKFNTVVVLGGRDHIWNELNSVEAYDMSMNKWTKQASMGARRFGCAAVVLGDSRILVIGGHDGSEWLASVEIYDYETNSWSDHLTDMPMPLQYCTAAVLTYEQRSYVFVTGRSDQRNEDQFDTANRTPQGSGRLYSYDVQNDRWATLGVPADIPGCVLTALGPHYLFAAGGCITDLLQGVKDTRIWNIASEKFDIDKIWDDAADDISLPSPPLTGRRVGDVPNPRKSHARPRESDASTLSSINGDYSDMGYPYLEDSYSSIITVEEDPCADHPLFSTPLSGRSCPTSVPQFLLKNAASALPPLPLSEEPILSRKDKYRGHIGRGKATRHDIEGTSHPLFTPPFQSESLQTRRRRSSLGSVGKTWVEDEQTVDNYGVPVIYTGQIFQSTGRPHGNGQMAWKLTGDVYTGHFLFGARHGSGQMAYANGDQFEGMFEDDQREGYGRYAFKDGRTYCGIYVDDEAEDPNGTMTWKDGSVYVGQFTGSKRSGKGRIRFPNNKGGYEGGFRNGKYHGYGVLTFANGSVYKGQWKKGEAYGKGQLVNTQGEVVRNGRWSKENTKNSAGYQEKLPSKPRASRRYSIA